MHQADVFAYCVMSLASRKAESPWSLVAGDSIGSPSASALRLRNARDAPNRVFSNCSCFEAQRLLK